MGTNIQKRVGLSVLVLLAVGFVAAVILSNQLLKGLRIDLTGNNLYTLSDGTRRILDKIEEPINLYFYFSDRATRELPQIRDYAERVREMLEEFEDEADGKIDLRVVDPLPFSEEEDRAAQFGLQGVPLPNAPDPVYMGLVGTNAVGDEATIPFFQPDREAFLEYDLAKLVSSLVNPELSVVGLVSAVPLTGGFDPQMQRQRPGWIVYQQASQLFEIRNLGTAFEEVDEEIDVLWIVQPRGVDEATQYAIDQFVMRGGKALIFVDPVAAVDPLRMEGMPQGMPPQAQGSNLAKLFDGWGIGFTAGEVVADAELALPISTGLTPRPTRHYGYLGVTAGLVNDSDIVTAELNVVNLAMAGALSLAEGSALTIEPLLESTGSSALLPASRFTFLPDPTSLQQGFVPSGERRILAARFSGTLASAFPDGPPEAQPTPGIATDDEEPPAEDENARNGYLAESAEPVNIIVVADVDMLSDSMWVEVQNFFGQQIANAFASNGALVVNALENLSGSSDLIAVRSRATFTRPFTRVERLRAEAEARFQETEERLQEELAETERRLSELQSSREDTGAILLTPEQEAEIDRFVDQRAAIRKELRAVQRGLDRDIERLGTVLKVINIGLVPLLLTVFVLVAVWRRQRRGSS